MEEIMSYEVLSPKKCKALIYKNKDLIILDVRTKMEHDFEGKLENSILIDFLKPRIFKKEINKLDRNAEYLIYCSVGKASALACNQMTEYGFHNVVSMAGGLKKWQEDQDLVTTVSKLDSEEIIEKRKKIAVRLSKVEGQMAGVKRMVLDGAYCGDILNQSLAVKAAFRSINKEIMEMFFDNCVNTPEQKEDFYKYLNKLM